MSELQINEIKVIKEDLSRVDCGGGYRYLIAEIHVDTSLPIERQKESVLHEVLGAFLGTVIPTDTIEEIARAQNEALYELESH